MRPFEGMDVCIWGQFEAVTRKDVWRALMDLGAQWVEEGSGMLELEAYDLFVMGDGVAEGSSHQDCARSVMDEAAFLQAAGLADWSLDERLGHLRGVLSAEPSAQTWEAMCAVFDGWPWERHGLDVAVEYAMAHLRHWPEALRVLPERWARYDEWFQVDPRVDLMCVTGPSQGAGHLVSIANPAFFEPFADHPGLGDWKAQDAEGRRLAIQGELLSLTDAQGNVLHAWDGLDVQEAGFSHCERYIWSIALASEGTFGNALCLLDARNFELVDEVLLRCDVTWFEWDEQGFHSVFISPDGRQLAFYSVVDEDTVEASVYWFDGLQIDSASLELPDDSPGNVLGFSPDGSRVVLISARDVLSVFSLPDGRCLWHGDTVEAPLEADEEPVALYFSRQWLYPYGMVVGPDVTLVRVHDEAECNAGFSVHSTATGAPLGCVGTGPLSPRQSISSLKSERLCQALYDDKHLRYLPAVHLIRVP